MSTFRAFTRISTRAAVSPITTTRRAFTTSLPRMVVHNVRTREEFEDALKNNSKVIVDCFATWCGPCKAIAPILVNLSNEDHLKDVHFVKFDVDEIPDLTQELGIRAMPTFLFFKDGDKFDSFMGADKTKLEGILQTLSSA